MAIWIALAGVAGVFSRWGFQRLWVIMFSAHQAWATFIINFWGSLLIGALSVAADERGWISTDLRTALSVGFLGGFTTFSAYSLDSWLFLSQGDWARGSALFIGSPLAGLIGVTLGVSLARGFLG